LLFILRQNRCHLHCGDDDGVFYDVSSCDASYDDVYAFFNGFPFQLERVLALAQAS